jgi:hypothetical protein
MDVGERSLPGVTQNQPSGNSENSFIRMGNYMFLRWACSIPLPYLISRVFQCWHSLRFPIACGKDDRFSHRWVLGVSI